MEAVSSFPDSPMDENDVVYPCKGCGEVFATMGSASLVAAAIANTLMSQILEEGKAFELGMQMRFILFGIFLQSTLVPLSI